MLEDAPRADDRNGVRRAKSALRASGPHALLAAGLAAGFAASEFPSASLWIEAAAWAGGLASIAGLLLLMRAASPAPGTADGIPQSPPEPNAPKFGAGNLAALAILMGFGFLFRIARLGEYGFHRDEGFFCNLAVNPSFYEVWKNSLPWENPPGLMFMLHLTMKISHDEFWLRLPIVLSGTLLIWLIFVFAREAAGTAAGLAAAFLMTVSPGMVQLSRILRSYSPALAFALCGLWFLMIYANRRRTAGIYIYGLFMALALSWHYAHVVTLISAGLVIGGRLALLRSSPREWGHAALAHLPPAAFLVWALAYHFSAMDPGVLRMSASVFGADAWFRSAEEYVWAPLENSVGYFFGRATGPAAPAAAPMAILFAASLAAMAARTKWFLLSLCAAPILVQYAFYYADRLPFGRARWVAHLSPFIFCSLAWGFAQLAGLWQPAKSNARGGWLRLAIAGPLVAAAAMAFAAHGAFLAHRRIASDEVYPLKAELKKIWPALKERVGPNDVVVVGDFTLLIAGQQWGVPRRPYSPAAPRLIEYDGLKLYYPGKREAAYAMRVLPQTLLESYGELRRNFGIRQIDNLWSVSVPGPVWEPPLSKEFPKVFPEYRPPPASAPGSRQYEWCFVVDRAQIEQLTRKLKRAN